MYFSFVISTFGTYLGLVICGSVLFLCIIIFCISIITVCWLHVLFGKDMWRKQNCQLIFSVLLPALHLINQILMFCQ